MIQRCSVNLGQVRFADSGYAAVCYDDRHQENKERISKLSYETAAVFIACCAISESESSKYSMGCRASIKRRNIIGMTLMMDLVLQTRLLHALGNQCSLLQWSFFFGKS